MTANRSLWLWGVASLAILPDSLRPFFFAAFPLFKFLQPSSLKWTRPSVAKRESMSEKEKTC